MSEAPKFIDDDIFTIANVFSAQECLELIARAEEIGSEAASVRIRSGPRMMPQVRNNTRVVLTDAELAEIMWVRVRDVLPRYDSQHAIGVDEQLRFYRYEPGQDFKRHKDGVATDSQGRQSKLSYLIYLNSDYTGGRTTFRDYIGQGENREKIVRVIEPLTGSALLFRHQRWHESEPLESGVKYVLRIDVFFAS
ncbi:MAG: 2OG-Fe(II) oxygenase [Planctomycetota bacterium]